MGKNLLTKFLKLKENNDTNNKYVPRKTHKRKSKIMRKSKKNKYTSSGKGKTKTNKRSISPIDILKKSPGINPIRSHVKNPVKYMNLRKSVKTSKKDKLLKKKYFDLWDSGKSKYNITSMNPLAFPSSMSYTKPSLSSNIFSDSSILEHLGKMNFDVNNKDDKADIEMMRLLLEKIKTDNKRIEKLLENQLDMATVEEEKDDPTIYKCIKKPMTTIKDLIEIGKLYEEYKDDDDTYFNIDLKSLHNMKEPLELLDSMIGLKHVKSKIIDEILFYIQHLENGNNDFLHTTLYGNPGVGKTELGRIIGKIYSSLGFLSSGHVIEAHAENFIGSVVGQTALKTRAILDKAIGGVLVIDEAYALGNKDGKSYVDDFINTLLPFLTEHRNDFVCILMGYKSDIEDNLFSKNKGLKRRFPNNYTIKDYNITELRGILMKKIKEYGWYYDDDAISLDILKKYESINKKIFENNGGSMENLFKYIKLTHSKRVLYYPPEKKKTINKTDFEKGIELYLNSIEKNESDKLYKHIYS